MVDPKRNRSVAALCLTAMLCLGGMAAAQSPDSSIDAPAMQALTNSPAMQSAIAASRQGNDQSAAAFFLAAARQGNPLAQVTLGRFYFEGRGVSKNYGESLKWLKLVIEKNQEPTVSLARGLLKNISVALRNSPNRDDKLMGEMAALLPLTANPYARQWNYNMEHTLVVPCLSPVC